MRRRPDPLTGLVLTVPVFLLYHLGIVVLEIRNGVDLVSRITFHLLNYDLWAYVAATLSAAGGILATAWWLRREGRIRPVAMLPVMLESAVLAVLMMVTVGRVVREVFSMEILSPASDLGVGPPAMTPFAKVVMAAGAGFHEELVFRVVLFGGAAWALQRFVFVPPGKGRVSLGIESARWNRALGLTAAAVGAAVLFSAVHYWGALGDTFSWVSFTFRMLAGLYLTLVYRLRGFATAVYTHFLYDIMVFFFFG